MGKFNRQLQLFCAFFFTICSVVTGQSDTGLVLHATFDNDAGDSGPLKLHGSLNGAMISHESAVGTGAVYFDGINDYVEFPSNVAYFNGDYSISIWARMESCKIWSRILDFNQDMPGSGNSITWLIGRPGHTQNNMWFDQWVVYENNPVESIIDLRRINPADAYLGYDIVPGIWTHYVITYNSAAKNYLGIQVNTKGQKVPLEGEVTLYVNGKRIGTNKYCLNPQGKPTVANWLGRSRFDADPYYKGYMDDFRIYDRVLSKNEIAGLFMIKNPEVQKWEEHAENPTGFNVMRPVLASACGTGWPWSELGDLVKKALLSYGNDVILCRNWNRDCGPRLVATAAYPPYPDSAEAEAGISYMKALVDFGVTASDFLTRDYHGSNDFGAQVQKLDNLTTFRWSKLTTTEFISS